jgi:hypothetical protein
VVPISAANKNGGDESRKDDGSFHGADVTSDKLPMKKGIQPHRLNALC